MWADWDTFSYSVVLLNYFKAMWLTFLTPWNLFNNLNLLGLPWRSAGTGSYNLHWLRNIIHCSNSHYYNIFKSEVCTSCFFISFVIRIENKPINETQFFSSQILYLGILKVYFKDYNHELKGNSLLLADLWLTLSIKFTFTYASLWRWLKLYF